MSINIYIFASRKISFKKKNGKRGSSTQEIKFNAWQTPTSVTRKILASADRAQAYIDWVLADCSRDESLPVYAEDDIFGEREPIRHDIYNAGKDHVEEFKQWIFRMEEEGFTIKFEMI